MKTSTMDNVHITPDGEMKIMDWKPVTESVATPEIQDNDIVTDTPVSMNCTTERGGPPPPKLLVRQSMLRNKSNEYRIYLQASHRFTSEYINRLCRFLDTRTSSETVTIYLGNNLHSSQIFAVGGVVSAIARCHAQVTAVAMGNCGVPETMIFAYAHKREMRRYSALTVGGTKDIEDILPMYRNFYEVFFNRLVEVGIIDQDICDRLWKYHDTIMVMAKDYNRSNV